MIEIAVSPRLDTNAEADVNTSLMLEFEDLSINCGNRTPPVEDVSNSNARAESTAVIIPASVRPRETLVRLSLMWSIAREVRGVFILRAIML
jgi:hypothetical protein